MNDAEEKDLFDRMMSLPGLIILEPFYKRHKEVLLYLFFGGLTFVVSMVTFVLFYQVCSLNELIANVISWIFAVLFAYFTNRIWVFDAPTDGITGLLLQMARFFGVRIATLAIEEFILLVFITWLRFPGVPVKVAAQIVVIILNYSKRI